MKLCLSNVISTTLLCFVWLSVVEIGPGAHPFLTTTTQEQTKSGCNDVLENAFEYWRLPHPSSNVVLGFI